MSQNNKEQANQFGGPTFPELSQPVSQPQQSQDSPNLNQKSNNSPESHENESHKAQMTSKMQYLAKLKQQNHQMLTKIKLINEALDEQVKIIEKKYIQKLSVPISKEERLHSKRKFQIEQKYTKIDKLKKQLETKLAQKYSLSSLQSKLNQLKASYKQKFTQMQQNQYKLHKLKKISNGKQMSSTQLHNSVISYEGIKSEREELREKIKRETERIYSSKQEFINNNKKNRGYSTVDVRDIRANQKQKGVQKSPQREQEDEDSNLSEAAKELKREYNKIGKRIQLLKIQKLSLIINTDHKDRKKYLKHLHSKIAELKKICPH